MSHRFLLSALLSLILSINLFGQSSDIVDGCAPLTVNFMAPAGSSTYFWDFKDVATSNLQNPSNTFLTPGVYDVEFRETPNGPTLGTITITVLAKPVPVITSDKSRGCAPHTVNFMDATTLPPSVSVTSYSWVFSDGGTALGNNVNHTFFTAGNFWVSLELNTSSPSCNVTKQFNNFVSISTPPNVGFTTTPDPAVSCSAPLTVSFSNTSISANGPLSYQWSFGNGDSSKLTTPNPVTYTQEGSFSVKLVATDTNGCSNSITKLVNIGPPTIDLTYIDTICASINDTIRNNSSAGSYTWTFSPNIHVRGYHLGVHPIVDYLTRGSHTLSLRVSSMGCSTDTTFTVVVDSVEAEFSATPTYSCSYPVTINYTSSNTDVISYEWVFKDSVISSAKDTSINYQNENLNKYSINELVSLPRILTVESVHGCRDTISAIDTVYLPNALMLPSVVRGCVPLKVTFSDSSSAPGFDTLVKWKWVYGDGSSFIALEDTSVNHTYNSIGEYKAYLIVTNESGCTDTSYQTTIRVGDKIVPDFSVNPSNICVGDMVQFTDLTTGVLSDSIDTWHYSAESDRMFSCFDDPNPNWTFLNETGAQSVTLTVGFNGCYSTVTKPGIVNVDGAVAEIFYTNYCDQAFDVQFTDSSDNASSIQWRFGDGQLSVQSNPLHNYATPNKYTVILKAEDLSSSCPATFDTSIVHIQDLKANFFTDTILCKGVPIPYDASSSIGVDSSCYKGYRWSFSDSLMRPVTTASPTDTFTFEKPGFTTISLIVSDANGCKDTLQKEVNVFGVESDFSFDKNDVCAPVTINFSDSSKGDTTIVSWKWNFGDGSGYLKPDTAHTYTTYSSFRFISLIVTDTLGCTDTMKRFLNMYRPTSQISLSDDDICAGDEVYFSASDFTSKGSFLNFDWDFSNGDSSKFQADTIQFDTAGTYPIKLVITEDATGCMNTIQDFIDVKDIPIAGFISSSDSLSVICPNENVLFTDTTITSYLTTYQWDFGNNRTSNFKDPGTVFINNGQYVVQLIATMHDPYGCADTTSKVFDVKGPQGNFTTDLFGDTICRLDSVLFTIKDTVDVEKYTWDFGDGSTVSNVSPISHQYTFVPPSGQTIAKLVLSNSDGSCPITHDTLINIYEVVADFRRNDGIDTAFCFAPLQLTNLSTNADEWKWDFGDKSTSNTENPLTHIYDSAGTYTITLAVKNIGLTCVDSISKEVILHPIPEISVVADTICEGNTAISFVNNPNSFWTYNWMSLPTTTITNNGAPSVSSQPLINTLFTSMVVDTNGCTNSDSGTVIVINPLNLTDFDTSIVIGDKINLPVYANASLYNFTWTPTEGLSCLDCFPPSVQPLEDIIYNLNISDLLGCFNDNVNYDIKIIPETFIKMPTSFTPNGDGINDRIFVKGWGIRNLLEYQIFNRWGELIFETSNIEEGWDGSYKGVLQNNDVYVFKIRVSTWKDEEKSLEGYINLKR